MRYEQAELLFTAILQAAGDEERDQRLADLRSTAERLAEKKNVRSWGALGELLGQAAVKRARTWLREAFPGSVSELTASGGLPVIQVNDRPLRLVSADAITALAAQRDEQLLFHFGTMPVRLAYDADGHARSERLSDQTLKHYLARAADFVALRRGYEVHVPPPLEVSRDILASPQPIFRALAMLRSTPTVRPDMTVVTTPGYDVPSAIFYAPPPGFCLPQIPAAPSPLQLREAVALLDEALADFCYADQASRANAYGFFLTPLTRPAIAGYLPIETITAPQQGTGKSFLAAVGAVIATGRAAHSMAEPEDEAEWRKALTAAARDGDPVIVIDNLKRALSSAQLARFITSDVVSDRLLGHSEMVHIPQHALVVVTANNVVLGGDIGRRCVLVRLDPKSPRPWLGRAYRHPDLLQWAQQHQAALVAAALTVVQGWVTAGRPPATVPVIDSFGDWCRTIGSILAWTGIAGFLGNIEAVYESLDIEGEQWELLLAAIAKLKGEEPFTAAWLASQLQWGNPLQEVAPEALVVVLPGAAAGISVRVSVVLRQQADRRYGARQLRLTRAGKDSHHKVALWQVREGAS